MTGVHPLEDDNTLTLYVRVVLDQRFDFDGGQGRNRTTDRWIFNPVKAIPRAY
jgi:ATP-dependent Clp protease adapter protein ClpS